jgi:pyruvate formate lyase activating enzyme
MQSLFRTSGSTIECLLCPHYCKIAQNNTGICGVRKNTGTKLDLLTYGVISGYSSDPIEKKPLYHFFPGKKILSVGSYGCNMRCDFCQNFHISQNVPGGFPNAVSVNEIVKNAMSISQNIGIAFTYNEPVIWFEFAKDLATAVKSEGLNTVMVTNGYINPDPLDELTGVIDAFNVDLKAFNNHFYKKLTGASLDPVKLSLKKIAKTGRHLEITTLIITGQNDNISEMEEQVKWISGELGKDVPLHLSRYFPMYKRDDPVTPEKNLTGLREVALKYLNFVYTGNTRTETGQDTYCPDCGTVVTRRSGYITEHPKIKDGKCTECGKEIYKYFTSF